MGVASGISATPTSLRMCPPLTTKNWPYYTPVVAVGTSPCVSLCVCCSSVLYKECILGSCSLNVFTRLIKTILNEIVMAIQCSKSKIFVVKILRCWLYIDKINKTTNYLNSE